MTTSETYFKEFVKKISPDNDSSKNAQDAHNNLRTHLEGKDEFSDSFLYGSYIRYTAIHNIDDVDICMILNIDKDGEEGEPRKVLRKLKKYISEFYKAEWNDEKNTDYNRRSIFVKNVIENSNLTLDVIPAIKTEENYLLVPDRELEKWVKTNPKGHIEFSQKMNTDEKSNKLFISVVKVFKHLKKFHIKSKHPKGFWIETLVGLNYKKENTIIESLYSTLVNILNKYGDYKDIPSLKDIGLEKETIKTSMEFKDFEKFINLLKKIKDNIENAISSVDKEYSLNIYKHIFGEEHFPIILEKEYINNSKEEFITKKFGYKENLDDTYVLKIICQYETQRSKYEKNKNVRKYNSIHLSKKEVLNFTYTSNTPNGTCILWKVRNYGVNGDKIRGEIGKYTNLSNNNNIEHTAYLGTHTVECFAVYNNQIIAKDIFNVNVYET